MVAEKRKLYPWLFALDGRIGCRYCQEAPVPTIEKKSGMNPAKEWTQGTVGFAHGDTKVRSSQLTSLRKKIKIHLESNTHKASATVFMRKQTGSQTQALLSNQFAKHQSATEKLFRIAYNIAKMDRPYTDFPSNVDCYKACGVDVGVLLHTDTTCCNIINSIVSDMRSALVKAINEEESKISVMVDESTTVANKTGLVIHIRACLAGKPTTFFLDLVFLPLTDAVSISKAILHTLNKYGFSDDFLRKHFICFASDGASVMTGCKSGVATRLKDQYPHLVLWHCANHRLELAVGDTVSEVSGLNHFKIFMDSLYSLYSQSPKLTHELEESAKEVSSELKKIGRVLDTRWSASSLRTVKAVWSSHYALSNHFQGKMNDNAKCKGLYDTLTSQNFITNLAIMHDALEEIARLSLSLQNRNVSMVVAHRLIDQTVKTFESLASNPGQKQLEAEAAVEIGVFKGQDISHKNIPAINSRQFYRSLANSIKGRMMTVTSRRGETTAQAEVNANHYQTLMDEVSILDPSTWPLHYSTIPQFGLNHITSLCGRFRVLELEQVCADFNLFLAKGGRNLEGTLVKLQDFVNCMPVSTADCERAFSVMNTVATKKRNRLEMSNLSSLMFVSILGPEIPEFKPKQYVKNWLDRGHHGATDTNSVKRVTKEKSGPYSHLQKYI